MSTRTVRQSWQVDGVLDDVSSAMLSDPTGTYGVKRNDTDAVVVAANTAMIHLGTGQYQYAFTDPGVAMTAYVKIIYQGQTYYFERDLPVVRSSTIGVLADYASLVNDVGYHLFGLRPTLSDVISDSVATANQSADILRAISKGLQFVYQAHRWSFLRPIVSITTRPPYTTGTVTVAADGVVTGIGTTFPMYSASAGGKLYLPNVGTYAVATYTSGASLTLADYGGGAITTATTYRLTFDTYPMPTGVDSLEGPLTYREGNNWPTYPIKKISELDVRHLLSRDNTPNYPSVYAETMNIFDPMAGSSRYVSFYPIPDAEYVLSARGTARPTMIDATNRYPLGIEVLAPCITEACLAAAEREIEQKDANHPDAIHNRALMPLLAIAIQRDQERSTPETLGVDRGGESWPQDSGLRGATRIWWNGGAGYTGFLPKR